jgi:hypothetical protein
VELRSHGRCLVHRHDAVPVPVQPALVHPPNVDVAFAAAVSVTTVACVEAGAIAAAIDARWRRGPCRCRCRTASR